MRALRTVAASTIITQLRSGAQGQMSHWGCGKPPARIISAVTVVLTKRPATRGYKII